MRILIASLLSAVALFFFGFLWWGILMPIAKPSKVITDAALIETLRASMPESGWYFYPDYTHSEHNDAGPMAIVNFHTDMPNMGLMMATGIGHMFISALLVSVSLAFSPRRTFPERFAFVFFVGLIVAVWADLGNMIWWRHPPLWTAYNFAYDLLSWSIAGIIIAFIVRPSGMADDA